MDGRQHSERRLDPALARACSAAALATRPEESRVARRNQTGLAGGHGLAAPGRACRLAATGIQDWAAAPASVAGWCR